MPADVRFSRAFLTGPLASTVRVLETAVTTIGREEGDVIINDPEASRRHARIEIHPDGTAWLSDLGSTNGTSTNGRTIDGPIQLADRQEFTCGRSTFMLLIRPIDTMSSD
jgi:pSer/pThr/pTyr-binding forkhead associated (FHA) protein